MFVCCECCVLLNRDLCDGLITRPEESYRLWRVVVYDQETSETRRLKPATGLWKIQTQWVVAPGKQTNKLSDFFCVTYTTKFPFFCPDSRLIRNSPPPHIVWMIEGLLNSWELCFNFMNENNYVEISNLFHVREVMSSNVVQWPLIFDSTGAENLTGQQPRLGNLTKPAMFPSEITPTSHTRSVEYRSLSK